jgi:DNA polymerase III epsilon subunit family exonuclease
MVIDLSCPLNEAPFVVVDIETTGFTPPQAKITEIAAIRVVNGEVDLDDPWVQLINPGCLIPLQIERLTGITNEKVIGHPSVDEVWRYFREFIEGSVLVAHNARFDMGFLDHDATRIEGTPLPHPELCTVKMSRRAWPGLSSYNLDTVASTLGLQFIDRHRALGDARVTAEVLKDAVPLLMSQGLDTLGKALRAQGSRRCESRLSDLVL